MISLMKKTALLSLLIFLGSSYAIAGNGEKHALIAYNVAAMTLTKLTVSDTLEQCNETMQNFKEEFPNESRFLFSCVRLADDTE